MDLDGITDFIALAECRSFSKAAEIRRVTQPAFSRRIQALETSVGATLIDRSVTPVALTRAGDRFLLHARLLAEAADRAVDEAQSQTSAIREPVYVAALHSLSYGFFPQWYRAIQKSNPDLRISLSAQRGSKCVKDVRSGVADLAIILVSHEVPSCFDLGGLESKLIGRETLVAVRAKFLKDNETNYLSYDKESYLDAMARHLLEHHAAAQLQVYFETSSPELLKAMALAGFGIAILPESLVSDDLVQGFLVPVFPKDNVLPCDILLLRMGGTANALADAVWQATPSFQGYLA